MGANKKGAGGPAIETAASPEARDVMDSFRRIVRWLRVSSRAAERDVGLSAAQLFVLTRLHDESALSLNELAERTLTHQSSASVVVSRLVERGLVQRVRSQEDARRIELTLTPAGRRLLGKAPHAAQDRLLEAMERMSRRDVQQLATLLQQLIEESGIREPAEMLFSDDEDNAESNPDNESEGRSRRNARG
jgi:DNA-binding MarR family transcriptional regulator